MLGCVQEKDELILDLQRQNLRLQRRVRQLEETWKVPPLRIAPRAPPGRR
jgi:hypothetical protein